jgi:putative endonuclease
MGEQIAEGYLVSQGCRVLARNWRCNVGEIDLVVQTPENELVIVEVKSRSSGRFGHGSEAITREKYKRLHNLARLWCRENALPNNFRIDVISLDGFRLPEITHLKRVIP